MAEPPGLREEDVADWARKQTTGRLCVFEPAAPVPCKTCPWRLENQGGRPDHPQATLAGFYEPSGRDLLWEAWGKERAGLCDGFRASCHSVNHGMGTDRRWDAGGDALIQRELLRWWERGRHRNDCSPLRGVDAVQHVIATVFSRFDPADIEMPGDPVKPRLDGRAVRFKKIVRLCHPGVVNPGIGIPQCAPLKDEEVKRWRRLGIGKDWAEGSGCAYTVAYGA
jgi:hypothetical protein